VIALFCARVFGIRKTQAFCYSAPPVDHTRDQLSGAASRGAHITRPTVERLTPIFRASSFCVAFGFPATSSFPSAAIISLAVTNERVAEPKDIQNELEPT
jgi:hypothetical protein